MYQKLCLRFYRIIYGEQFFLKYLINSSKYLWFHICNIFIVSFLPRFTFFLEDEKKETINTNSFVYI